MMLNKVCYGLLALSLCASFGFLHPFLGWFLLVNIVTFLIYGADKLAARRSWQRVPERTLLVFGLVGGWPGGLVAQHLFRHKTQKQPFRKWFLASVVVNVMVLVGGGYWIGYLNV
ncbi:DUF1294 domain-containing protein [Pseudocitrobacter cyperus]|uniref:DUF1294 domain-containing protein n=1 Tax=Pseudocitrobacter cyperus TaxID=3112843 RepID=A0ABV0HK77_9ENTR